MKFIFWIPVLSHHQIDFFNELNNKHPQINFQIITATDYLQERLKQGWTTPNNDKLNLIKLAYPIWIWIWQSIKLISDNPYAIHIFGGFWASRKLFLILVYLRIRKKKFGIISEPYIDIKYGYQSEESKIKSYFFYAIRLISYKFFGKFFLKYIFIIFAISPKAVNQFKKIGFNTRNIYPFGYFIDYKHNFLNPITGFAKKPLRLVYIGSLINRKGIDSIIEIALFLHERNIAATIDVYGYGDHKRLINISPNLNYYGIIPSGKTPEVLVNYDLLIVPSKFDGWGVVINEALQSFVPVLASIEAGASAIIMQSGAGLTFSPYDIKSLIDKIESLSKDRNVITEWKIKAQKYALKLTNETAVNYFLECISSNFSGTIKPKCPWYSINQYESIKNKLIKKRIVYFHRKPFVNNFSLESAFNAIRNSLPQEIIPVVVISKFHSKGILPRMYTMISAFFQQGDINHITGDIHFLALLLSPKKTVLTILDFVYLHNSRGIKRILLNYLWGIFPSKRVKFITVISESTKTELFKNINVNPNKVRVIPLCISDTFIRCDKDFNSLKPKILHVGTGKNKNLIRLIRALKDIPCRLEIIGHLSSEQTTALHDACIDYENSFDLSEEEVFHKYCESDLVAFISTYEGFGMPILEANSVGRPVITGNLYSMPEVAGNAACIVDSYDVSQIKNGILKIINDKHYREILVHNGFINIKRYNSKIVAEQYASLYREIAYS
jgi:glycosyltransferase involved in cell wall biosynthesis